MPVFNFLCVQIAFEELERVAWVCRINIITSALSCLCGGLGVWDCHGDKDSARPPCRKRACSFSKLINFGDTWQKYPRVFTALVFRVHASSSRPFLGFYGSEWQLQCWILAMLPWCWLGHDAYLPLQFIEEVICSSQCQEITFLTSVGFRGFYLLSQVESCWGTCPIGCHCYSGRQLPTDSLAAVSWQQNAVGFLGADQLYHGAKPGLRDAAVSQPHCCWQGTAQAKLPTTVCRGSHSRSWGPGETSFLMGVCLGCRSAGDNFCRWCHSSRERQAGLKAKHCYPWSLHLPAWQVFIQ